MHVPSRDDSDQRPIISCGKSDVEQSGSIRFAQGMKSWFDLAVFSILQNEQWLIKKDFFRFSLAHPMLFCIFSRISFVPIKTNEVSKINHICILPSYTSNKR